MATTFKNVKTFKERENKGRRFKIFVNITIKMVYYDFLMLQQIIFYVKGFGWSMA